MHFYILTRKTNNESNALKTCLRQHRYVGTVRHLVDSCNTTSATQEKNAEVIKSSDTHMNGAFAVSS